jgi:succinyl-CoA synthetase beta subunit
MPPEGDVKIHEYQGKAALASFGVTIPRGKVAYSPDEALEVAKELGYPVVVKAQIHAGGRGKGGGIKLSRSADETEQIAKAMLGMTLRTPQTGPEGRVVRRLLIEQGMDLQGSSEMYLAILVDRVSACPMVMASAQGGMDIEEVAARTPKAICGNPSARSRGSRPSRRVSSPSAWDCLPLWCRRRSPSCMRSIAPSKGWTLPWSRSTLPADPGGGALRPRRQGQPGRQRPLSAPGSQGAPRFRRGGPPGGRGLEALPQLHQARGGSVGCMVNGAGLAMATMDIIKLAGGARPTSWMSAAGRTLTRSATPSASCSPTRK